MNDNMNQNNNMNPMNNMGSNMNNNMNNNINNGMNNNINNGMNQQPMDNMGNMNNNMMNMSQNNMNMNNGMMNNNMPNNMNMNNGMMNNNMPNNMNQSPKKKNNTLLYVILGVVAVLLIVCVAVIALGGSGDSNSSTTEGSRSSSLTSLDNYKIEEHLLANKSTLLEFKNNNSVPVDASFKVEYYDKAGEVIDVEEVYLIGVPAKSSAYEEINYLGKVSYDTYKFTNMTVREDTHSENYKDDVEIVSQKDNEDFILLQFKNNSKKDLGYLTYIVLFYDKDGKIISFTPGSEMDFKTGTTLTSKVHHPYDDNFNSLTYEKYEVVIISGITK